MFTLLSILGFAILPFIMFWRKNNIVILRLFSTDKNSKFWRGASGVPYPKTLTELSVICIYLAAKSLEINYVGGLPFFRGERLMTEININFYYRE